MDPVSVTATIAAVAATTGVGQLAVAVVPLVKEKNAIRRLTRLEFLREKIEDGTMTPDDRTEIKKLISELQPRAQARENATILAYLEVVKLQVEAQKSGTIEQQIDLIMFDDDYKEQPQTEKTAPASLPKPVSTFSEVLLLEVAGVIYCNEQMQTHDINSLTNEHAAPSQSAVLSSSSRPSIAATSITKAEYAKDPIIEAIADAKAPKTHATLKNFACWSVLLTAGPIALVAPQVRRNLFNSKTKA